jgi:hypothetical protein
MNILYINNDPALGELILDALKKFFHGWLRFEAWNDAIVFNDDLYHPFYGLECNDKAFEIDGDRVGSNPILIVTDRQFRNDISYYPSKEAVLVSTFNKGELQENNIELVNIIMANIASILCLSSSQKDDIQSHNLTSSASDLPYLHRLSVSDAERIESLFKPTDFSDFFIYMTHGIRDYGGWLAKAKEWFKRKGCIKVEYRKYDRVSTLGLLNHLRITCTHSNEIAYNIVKLLWRYPRYKLVVVAHSYGTLLTYEAIEKVNLILEQLQIPGRTIHNIILIGSVLPCNCNWGKFFSSEARPYGVSVRSITNVCGEYDVMPVLASHFVKGTGAAGSLFFHDNSREIKNIRLANCGHSKMLKEDLFCKHIIPLALDETHENPNVPDASFFVRGINNILSKFH